MSRKINKPYKPKIFSINWWGAQSIRKPMAWLVVAFIIVMTISYRLIGEDIPEGIQAILKMLVAIPVTTIGSSSYEAARCQQEDDTEDDNNGDTKPE
jgi:hypothetical protein